MGGHLIDILFYFCFIWVLWPIKKYFFHVEPSQSIGGEKTDL